MRGLARSLAALLPPLALAAAPLAAQEPPATHVYRPGIDVLHYDLTVELPDSGVAIGGRAVLTVGRTAPVDTLVLDLIGMRVDSVRVEGRPTPFGRDSVTVRVPLPPGSGDTLRVAVRYGGEPRDGLIIRTDERGRWTGFGDNWPDRARFWIPSVDHPSDKATVSWTVAAPEEREVIANGVRVDQRAAGAGRRLTRFRGSRPIPVYLMVIGAGPLVEHPLGNTACGLAEGGGCVPQSVYTAPETEDFLPGPFGQADEIVEFFSSLIAPFPYEKLDHVQSSTRFGGMENASAIFYSDKAFREGTLGTGLIAHETAHQWFGDAVTEREWSHLWLSEGFATYLTQVWREHAEGPEALREGMRGIRNEILASAAVAERPVIDTAQTRYLELLNENSYEKGGFVLHMLRVEIGDSAFFAGLRGYYRDHRHGTALSEDLLRAMESASGEELDGFFDQWLRRPGYPELTTSWSFDAERGRVLLTVEQGERFGPFRFPLEVEVVDASGGRHRATVAVEPEASQEVVVPLELAAPPAAVVVDPEVRLLASFSVRR